MTKTCPIMSFRKSEWEEIFCLGEECAFWDEERGQCCLKTQALAAAGTPSNVSRQAEYVYPTFTTTPNNSGDNPYRIDC